MICKRFPPLAMLNYFALVLTVFFARQQQLFIKKTGDRILGRDIKKSKEEENKNAVIHIIKIGKIRSGIKGWLKWVGFTLECSR